LIDTCILCVWLKVPGMETVGEKNDLKDFNFVDSYIKSEVENGASLVLPITSVIETGNHIAHAKGKRMDSAKRLKEIIDKVANSEAPWLTIDQQKNLWTSAKLKELADRWIKGVETEKQSIGDSAIVEVFKHYFEMGFDVKIFTGDYGLKKYEYQIANQSPQYTPRRNKNR